MAIGRGPSERGGVIDPADVRGAGSVEWADLVGVPVDHPLVGGGTMPYDIDTRYSRIITTSAGQSGAATGVIATPEVGPGSAAARLDNWRDVFNFHGSPVPWLLVTLIAIIVLVNFSINASGSLSTSLRG